MLPEFDIGDEISWDVRNEPGMMSYGDIKNCGGRGKGTIYGIKKDANLYSGYIGVYLVNCNECKRTHGIHFIDAIGNANYKKKLLNKFIGDAI